MKKTRSKKSRDTFPLRIKWRKGRACWIYIVPGRAFKLVQKFATGKAVFQTGRKFGRITQKTDLKCAAARKIWKLFREVKKVTIFSYQLCQISGFWGFPTASEFSSSGRTFWLSRQKNHDKSWQHGPQLRALFHVFYHEQHEWVQIFLFHS